MRKRSKPKVWSKHDIYVKRDKVGYIQLVSYMIGDAKPHLEYHIDEPFRNKGIMSEELPKYLRFHKRYNPQLIALTKQDNVASKRLLEKNGFVKMKNIGDVTSYIIDLRFTADDMEVMINKIWGDSNNFMKNK